MQRPRVTAALVLALAVALVASIGCTRRSAVESSTDTSSNTTAALDTTTTPPAAPPTSDTTAPPSSDAVPPPEEPPDGVFGHSQAEIDEFRRIYSDAFRAECGRIWSHANPDGSLADPDLGDPYYLSDCVGELDPDWAEFADSNDEAFGLGVDDAQIAASDLADPLCNNAGQCWTYGD